MRAAPTPLAMSTWIGARRMRESRAPRPAEGRSVLFGRSPFPRDISKSSCEQALANCCRSPWRARGGRRTESGRRLKGERPTESVEMWPPTAIGATGEGIGARISESGENFPRMGGVAQFTPASGGRRCTRWRPARYPGFRVAVCSAAPIAWRGGCSRDSARPRPPDRRRARCPPARRTGSPSLAGR